MHGSRRSAWLGVACVVAAAVAATGAWPTAAGAEVTTRYGAVVKPQAGETFQQALARSESRYGRLGVIREFDGNAPDPWTSLGAQLTDHPGIVSWRIAPRDVLSGAWDTRLTEWFASAPTDRDTWFAYLHEPEDDIARGSFTAADFRDAFARVASLARAVGNPMLHSTLILMCYTVNPTSGRNWLDYYAGQKAVDVIGWDCYNHGSGPGGYGKPENLFGRAIATSTAAGEPWGIAEVGSVLRTGDTGTGRAAWLNAAARYLHANGALFVSYFDTNGGGRRTDYRLLDEPSRQAWYDIVSDQTP